MIYIDFSKLVWDGQTCLNLSKLDQTFSNWSKLAQSSLHTWFDPLFTTLTSLCPFLTTYPATSIDIFYFINIEKQWTFLNHLTIFSGKPCLWTIPVLMKRLTFCSPIKQCAVHRVDQTTKRLLRHRQHNKGGCRCWASQ